MKVPLSLLRSYCDPGLDPVGIASILALTGTEVERIRKVGIAHPEGFVVGNVLAADQHPDADRLRVCSVDVGAEAPARIVCGAPNVAPGQTVVVALPGATMPNGMKIKKAKLRGVKSNGMICGEDELDLGSGSEGILVLPEGFGAPGSPLSDLMTVDETVLDLEITPNRPDCLGVYGVARELHAATGAPLARPPWEQDHGTDGPLEGIRITVDDAELCPCFTARVYEGVDGGETPLDVRFNLHAAGMRSISPIVDITNWVMLVTGEPMHAFDLDSIEGGTLQVARASEGEKVTTLDGVDRALRAGDPVIRDAGGATSIAGVMGGARSEVSGNTRRVLLEAAVWHGPSINIASSRLALRSEASGRFEKGLAAIQTLRAQACASQLFQRIWGISPRPGTILVGDPDPRREEIQVVGPDGSPTELIGTKLEPERVDSILGSLGFETSWGSLQGLVVVPPPDRLDVTRPVDVVEEIARIDGLDRIPARLPTAASAGRLSDRQKLRRKLVDAFASQGLHEIAGWSFARPGLGDDLRLAADDFRRNSIAIANPMSEEESLLRTTLLGSVLDSAARNAARGNDVVRIFEVGPVYVPAPDDLSVEPLMACGVILGAASPAGWRDQSPRKVDVFDGIGVVASTLTALGLEVDTARPDVVEPFLHPGRSAVVRRAGMSLGWVGELHPLVAERWGLDGGVAFELDADMVFELVPGAAVFESFSSLPPVLQDVAFTVDSSVPSATLVGIAVEEGGAELDAVEVFDVYSGKQVGEGKVSIGLRLTFRAPDRTMTEEEATAIRTRITEAIAAKTGGEVRG